MERLSVIRTIRSLTFIKIALLNHFIIAIENGKVGFHFKYNCNDKMIEHSDFDESYRSTSLHLDEDSHMLRIVIRVISMEKTAFVNRHF